MKLPPSVLATIAIAAALPAQRSDVRLDLNPNGPSMSDSVDVAAGPGSTIYAVWNELRAWPNLDLFFDRSTDNGATWMETDFRVETTAPGLSGESTPRLATADDAVYVAWVDGRTATAGSPFASDVYFRASFDRGVTWMPAEVRVNTGVPGANEISDLVVAADGANVYAAWRDDRFSTVFAGSDVFVRRSTDGGVTWVGTETRINTGTAGADYCLEVQVAVAGDAVYVVWTDGRADGPFSNNYDVFFNRSLDRGVTWLASDVRLNTNPAGTSRSLDPGLAAIGNEVHVVWEDDRNGGSSVYANRSLDNGTTWLASDVRVDASGAARDPVVAATAGVVHVAWAEVGARYARSTDGGNSFGAPVSIGGMVPEQIAARGDSVFVSGVDSFDAFLQRSVDGGLTWGSQALRLSSDPPNNGLALRASMALGEVAFVAWTDFRTGERDIHGNIGLGAQPYGPGTPGTGGATPAHRLDGEPAIGATPSLAFDQLVGGAAGALLLGGSGSRTALPTFGGVLGLVPVLALPVNAGGTVGVAGAGSLSLPLPVPADPSLIGADVYSQGLFVDAGAALGLVFSNAIAIWIG